jgi:hypothetical protein
MRTTRGARMTERAEDDGRERGKEEDGDWGRGSGGVGTRPRVMSFRSFLCMFLRGRALAEMAFETLDTKSGSWLLR